MYAAMLRQTSAGGPTGTWNAIRPPRPSSTSAERRTPACLSARIAAEIAVHHASEPMLTKTPDSPTSGEVMMASNAASAPSRSAPSRLLPAPAMMPVAMPKSASQTP